MVAATLSRTTLYEMTVTMVGFIPNFCIKDIKHNDTQHTQCHFAQCCDAHQQLYYLAMLGMDKPQTSLATDICAQTLTGIAGE
jgi:hypothetical protein